MSTNRYTLEVTSRGSNACFIIVYRRGQFFRLEKKSGKLKEQQQWSKLLTVVPLIENQITEINQRFLHKGIVISPISIKNSKSLYSEMMQVYFNFYQTHNDLKPRIGASEGSALKSIISHLKTICTDDAEVLMVWQTILNHWHKLDTFYARQMELRQINSNIGSILRQIKHGKAFNFNKKQAHDHANDLRQSL